MPLIDWSIGFVFDVGKLNVDVDGDVGGERRRWGLKLSFKFGESGIFIGFKFDEICIGCEII